MSKVPCGGFELDDSLALKDGKLGLAPGAGGSQADWNVTDSSDPAFIKNKPFGDVPGVAVFSEGVSRTETNDDGNLVSTFTKSSTENRIEEGHLCDITLFSTSYGIKRTYSNIRASNDWISSTSWKVTFDTTGLPFTVVLESGYGMNTTVTVTDFDGHDCSYIIIVDKSLIEKAKLSAEYIDTSNNPTGLGYIFPTLFGLSGMQDKMHLVYREDRTFQGTFDTYLKSSGGKIFKLVVDDSGAITATQV